MRSIFFTLMLPNVSRLCERSGYGGRVRKWICTPSASVPTVFMKLSSSVVGPEADVTLAPEAT